jgi:hypothetical protein
MRTGSYHEDNWLRILPRAGILLELFSWETFTEKPFNISLNVKVKYMKLSLRTPWRQTGEMQLLSLLTSAPDTAVVRVSSLLSGNNPRVLTEQKAGWERKASLDYSEKRQVFCSHRDSNHGSFRRTVLISSRIYILRCLSVMEGVELMT